MGRETEWVGLSEASHADGRIRELEAEVERLRAKIEAALAHHQPKAKGSAVCRCGDRWYDGRCHSPTVTALTGGRE